MFSHQDLKIIFNDAQFINFDSQIRVSKVEHDTRKPLNNAMYIALIGDNFDGHNFVSDAYKNGAIVAVVEKYIESKIAQILVKNTLSSYLKIANYKRKMLNAKVIAVTGSNGKTTCKELIYSLINKTFITYKNEGNLNNQIGLPYTLSNVPLDAQCVVLEMGMNSLGEIKTLSQCAEPDIALITNIGSAHIGKLGSIQNILKAKTELFDYANNNGSLIIFNTKDKLLITLKHKYKNTINFLELKKVNEDSFKFTYKNEIFVIKSPLKGEHNLSNLAAALTVALHLGVDPNIVSKELEKFKQKDMRFEIIEINKVKYILDCYNANPDSMKAIIDYVSLVNVLGSKIAVIGDMNELGTYSQNFHLEIGEYLRIKGINKVFSIGKYSKYYKKAYNDDKNFFEISNRDVNFLKKEIKENDLVFFKASRTIKLEEIFKEVTL